MFEIESSNASLPDYVIQAGLPDYVIQAGLPDYVIQAGLPAGIGRACAIQTAGRQPTDEDLDFERQSAYRQACAAVGLYRQTFNKIFCMFMINHYLCGQISSKMTFFYYFMNHFYFGELTR